MPWRDDLEACFDRLERLFAFHTMNEERAFQLLASARAEGVTWRQFSDAVRDLMAGDGCTALQIERELGQVEARFRPWLREEQPFRR